MIEHLIDRTLHSHLGKREHAEDHKSHVGDRRIGDEAFHIRLHHRDQCTVNNADDRKRDKYPRRLAALVREQSKVEPHQAVRSHLK